MNKEPGTGNYVQIGLPAARCGVYNNSAEQRNQTFNAKIPALFDAKPLIPLVAEFELYLLITRGP